MRVSQFIVASCIFFGAAMFAPASGQGSVHGRVVDMQGNKVSEARVGASRGIPQAGVEPNAFTNQNGEFVITGLPAGSYLIHASKEHDGFGDSGLEFYRNHQSPRVELIDGADVVVTVILGPKAAFLTGTIEDEATGEPVDASVHLWRAKNPSDAVWIRMGANFRVLVPSGEDIGVEVLSDGHENWTIEGGPVHMEPGAVKPITPRLRKKL